ncbi:MAG: YceI family protein, partial [Ignavibacteriales bacterium]|nr:YceI family protein [Ignavibacteriales bacterium]
MKKVLYAIAALFVSVAGVFGQTTWTVDNVHSNVKFTVSHLIISEVEGSFRVYSGSIRSESSDFTRSAVEFAVDVNSINTDNGMRDN